MSLRDKKTVPSNRIQYMVKSKGFQQMFSSENEAKTDYQARKKTLERKKEPFKIELLQIAEDGKTSILEITKVSASSLQED